MVFSECRKSSIMEASVVEAHNKSWWENSESWIEKNGQSLIRMVSSATLLISLFAVSCVAIDRYIALVWAPMKYHLIVTPKSCTLAVIIVIASQTFVGILLNLYRQCEICFPMILFLYIALNVTLYIVIYKSIGNNRKSISIPRHTLDESKRLLRTFCIIVGVFTLTLGLVCFMYIFLIVNGTIPDPKTVITYYLCYFLMTINSLANPIIYWFRLSEFRKAVKNIFCLRIEVN
ncbi:G-protein coupled receptor 12-like isoform X2 [Anneissia japonica]|uniref:G-protein coupled receptor 12-like isoform X2 n=1 Tax=Anneissia japonica TaxID=1529436 RepID=UPI001425AC9B|nr:G-protein coupled receptor 12-like isoform X2 [Anneissia japonica]